MLIDISRYLNIIEAKRHVEKILSVIYSNIIENRMFIQEDDDKIFTSDEPFEEMGSEAVEVHALKEEEFAQTTMLGEHVSYPNGIALSFVWRQVPTIFPMGIT
ncbi:hypothetical protein Tco_0854984 [Tanacetum coccineum]